MTKYCIVSLISCHLINSSGPVSSCFWSSVWLSYDVCNYICLSAILRLHAKKLSSRRDTARCFVSLKLLKVTQGHSKCRSWEERKKSPLVRVVHCNLHSFWDIQCYQQFVTVALGLWCDVNTKKWHSLEGGVRLREAPLFLGESKPCYNVMAHWPKLANTRAMRLFQHSRRLWCTGSGNQ